jgi:hypothetical protein
MDLFGFLNFSGPSFVSLVVFVWVRLSSVGLVSQKS